MTSFFLILGHVLLGLVSKSDFSSSAHLLSEYKICKFKTKELEYTSLRERQEGWVTQGPPAL